MNQTTLVSVAIIIAGCLLIAYDERYGPKDDVMYLRIFPSCSSWWARRAS